MNVKLTLEPNERVSISRQLATQLEAMIRSRQLAVGTRLPSIRQLSAEQKISSFPVIEAYDQLASLGLVQAKHGSGYYVTTCPEEVDGFASLRQHVEPTPAASSALMLSSGYIPELWRDVEGIAQVVKQVARTDPKSLTDYAMPEGESSLRAQIVLLLRRLSIDAHVQNILTTNSASHALDLIIRLLVKPGDTVLVEDPGYFNLFEMVRMQGAQLIAVPRNERGPDIAALECLLKTHRTRLCFINSALHNPTGGAISSQTAFRLLQLAEQYDVTIVEDDVYADFQAVPTQRLAALDQLERVVYVGGFSKTLSSSLRTGWIAAQPTLVKRLIEVKTLTGSTSMRLNECVVASLLERGLYRKHLERLRRIADRAFSDAQRQLHRAGWVLHPASRGGYNLWARCPGIDDSATLVALASNWDIKLIAGSAFRPSGEPTPWIRINAVHLTDRRAQAFLDGAVASVQVEQVASIEA
jgi:DNA-binding transcriptional MocR family regulator